MPKFLNACVWKPTSGGTGTWTVDAAVAPYNTPADCADPAVEDGETYNYHAKLGSDYERGTGVYTVSGTTLTRNVIESTNSDAAVNFSAAPEVQMGNAFAGDFLPIDGASRLNLINGKIVESHTGGAATFAIKGLDGNDPSAANPVGVPMPDGSVLAITSALALTISSGSTLGFTDGAAGRLWFAIADDGGTPRLVARNCSDGTGVYGFPGHGVLSATAEGGAGGADSAGVSYAAVTITAKPFTIIGFADYDSGLTTAGTWDAAPTRIQLFGAGMAKPGDIIQVQTGGSATPFSTTSSTPQTSNTSVPITLSAPQNIIRAAANGNLITTANSIPAISRLYCDSAPFGNIAAMLTSAGAQTHSAAGLGGVYKPGTVSEVTVAVKVYNSDNATTVYFGDTNLSSIAAEEVMG